jgi:hypothetical protein
MSQYFLEPPGHRRLPDEVDPDLFGRKIHPVAVIGIGLPIAIKGANFNASSMDTILISR